MSPEPPSKTPSAARRIFNGVAGCTPAWFTGANVFLLSHLYVNNPNLANLITLIIAAATCATVMGSKLYEIRNNVEYGIPFFVNAAINVGLGVTTLTATIGEPFTPSIKTALMVGTAYLFWGLGHVGRGLAEHNSKPEPKILTSNAHYAVGDFLNTAISGFSAPALAVVAFAQSTIPALKTKGTSLLARNAIPERTMAASYALGGFISCSDGRWPIGVALLMSAIGYLVLNKDLNVELYNATKARLTARRPSNP